MEFCQVVKRIRLALKLSQEDLARELGVSYATINRWENGKSTPSRLALSAIKEFCEKNGVTYEDTTK